MCSSLSYKQIWPWHTACPRVPWRHFKWACFVPYRRHLKKRTGGGSDRTPREGQALRWRSSSQDVTGCWLEDAQEGLGRPTKTALQLQGVVFQAPASPLAATQRVLACTGPRPGRQGSKARSFIYSGCCWGLGISCLGEVEKKKTKKQVPLSLFSWGLPRKITLSSPVVHTLVSAVAPVCVSNVCTVVCTKRCCWLVRWVYCGVFVYSCEYFGPFQLSP